MLTSLHLNKIHKILRIPRILNSNSSNSTITKLVVVRNNLNNLWLNLNNSHSNPCGNLSSGMLHLNNNNNNSSSSSSSSSQLISNSITSNNLLCKLLCNNLSSSNSRCGNPSNILRYNLPFLQITRTSSSSSSSSSNLWMVHVLHVNLWDCLMKT